MQLNRYISPRIKNKLRPLRCIFNYARNFKNIGKAKRHRDPYATHLPVLIGIRQLFKIRRVLELGCGKYSTPTFLDKAIFPDLEALHTVETDSKWSNEIEKFVGSDSRLCLILAEKPMKDAVDNINFDHYDLIFVDDSTYVEERVETIRVLSSRCSSLNVVVIHDYENKEYQIAASKFSHQFKFDMLNPYTGIVWNDAQIKQDSLKEIYKRIRKYSKSISPNDARQWAHILSA